jgi:hypothetical protein
VIAPNLIAVNMKWWVNGADAMQPEGLPANGDILVTSGKEFVRKVSFGDGHTYETQCVASLYNPRRSRTRDRRAVEPRQKKGPLRACHAARSVVKSLLAAESLGLHMLALRCGKRVTSPRS